MSAFNGPSVKKFGCYNCDHYQDYGVGDEIGVDEYGECRAHPPVRCCPGMQPTNNNFPQIDQAGASADLPPLVPRSFWCSEWKRTTKLPFPEYTPTLPD